MAKIDMGILGGFSGRVGSVVGYRRGGQWFVRAYRQHVKDRRSAAQQAQRSRFKAMIQFASPATPVLRVGLRQMALRQGLTEGNCFLKINKDHFGETPGSSSISGQAAFSGVGVDCPRLQFSAGRLAAPRGLRCAIDGRGVLSVRWSADGGRLTDSIHVYAYSPAAGRGIALEGDRSARHLQALLPEDFAGAELHVWAFAADAAGEASPTVYAAPDGTPVAPSLTAPATAPSPHPIGVDQECMGYKEAEENQALGPRGGASLPQGH